MNNELSNDTTNNAPPLWQKLSASTARLIVHLWPNETKDWGRAFQAELTEIESPWQSFCWLLGGVMLLTRERFKSFVRSFGRPVGIPAGDNLELISKHSARVPRTPRVVTFLLLLASLGILLHPEVRTGLRAIVRAYINPHEDTFRWSTVRQLRKEAEKTHDPKILALLSLLSDDSAERQRLADEAIGLDPSLTWVDYENLNWGTLSPSDPRRVSRLQAWDPDNAAVRLISAEPAFNSSVSIFFTTPSFIAISADPKLSADSLQKDPQVAQWLTNMNRAYAAGRYDNYGTRVNQLIRDLSASHPSLDPDIAAYILPRERIPNLWNIQSYAKWLLYQGKEAERRNDLSAAADSYWKVMRFSEMMRQSRLFLIERFIGSAIGREAAENLQPLLEKAGRSNEAQVIGFRLTEWSENQTRSWQDRWIHLEWSGFSIQLVAVFILLLSIFSIISLIVSLASRRNPAEKRGVIFILTSWAIDACPLLLLLFSSALYFLYHPFAQTYSRFIHITSITPDVDELWGALSVTHLSLLGELFGPAEAVFRSWVAITSILVLLALFLIVRMLKRGQSAQSS